MGDVEGLVQGAGSVLKAKVLRGKTFLPKNFLRIFRRSFRGSGGFYDVDGI